MKNALKISRFFSVALLGGLTLFSISTHAGLDEGAVPSPVFSAMAKNELSGGAAPNPPELVSNADAASIKEERLVNLSLRDAMKAQDQMRAVEFYLKSGPAAFSNNISTVSTASGKPKH